MIELEPDFKKFLADNFQFEESMFDSSVDIYSSTNLKLRIVRDGNTKLYMDISTLENPQTPSDWIILADLRSYILNNDDYLKASDFREVSTFFQENYQNILSLLDKNYDDVRKALKERGQHRAKLMFGPLPKQGNKDLSNSTTDDQQLKKKPWWKL